MITLTERRLLESALPTSLSGKIYSDFCIEDLASFYEKYNFNSFKKFNTWATTIERNEDSIENLKIEFQISNYEFVDLQRANQSKLGNIPNLRAMLATRRMRTGETRYPNLRVAGFNACVTGDTLVAVADGRNAVPIKELVGTTYPIYTVNKGKVTIGKSIKTWKTRENAEVWHLTLDDGSILNATPDHLVMLRTGEYKALSDLVAGESLMPFNSYVSNNHYRQIASNTGRDRRQYRLIAEYNKLIVNPKVQAIHHRNFDSLDDSIDNLQVMLHTEHRQLHCEKMKGANNPVCRMSRERFKEVYKNFTGLKGENNPMFGKRHSAKTKALIGKKSKENWKRQPQFMSQTIKDAVTPETRLKISKAKKAYAAKMRETKVIVPKDPSILPGFTGRHHTEESKAKISATQKGRIFSEEHRQKLSEKAKLRYNHKVVSVSFSHLADVYDMTVESTHNFGVITSAKDQRFIVSSGVFIHNCAE